MSSANPDLVFSRPAFSKTGSYIAYSSVKNAESGWTTFLVNPIANVHIERRRKAMFPPVAAFARDESVAVAATDPSSIALVTSSATYTRTCNDVASADHRLQAMVTAKTDSKTGNYVDAQVVVVDLASGQILHRFALGAGPRGMGENVAPVFSPRGLFLDVVFGDNERVFDLQRGIALPDDARDVAFSSTEAVLFRAQGDGLAVTTLRDGKTRLFSNNKDLLLRGNVLEAPERHPRAEH